MAMTNHERVGRAMDLLKEGLAPFVDREFKSAFGNNASSQAALYLGEERINANKPVTQWDVSALLKVMWDGWNEVFKRTLGFSERSLVSELRDFRNRWAHQQSFSSDDTYRVLDSAGRLLSSVSASQSDDIERMKTELLRLRYDEQVRGEKRKSAVAGLESAPTGLLKSWREVVTPHKDVASGEYQNAEFAADLWQVHLGEGSPEYRDPVEFYRRTYLTESLKGLLIGAVKRLSGTGGDPVIQLQTNFGGGKTHSMLALYHLFSGRSPIDLVGVDKILAEAGLEGVPKAKRVVLVGNKISPGNPVTKPDGTVVRTLWGELAWQLGGKTAYERIRADDERATNPGDALRELFNEFGPCLILIDEWVAYARMLHDQRDLPAGTFETQFTFAQALTESAKLANACFLVISLPASDTSGVSPSQTEDVEVGGIRGREALDRLRNVVGRVESSWRPASAEEGFEIVRRRLFEPMTDPDQFKQRDLVARSFGDMYKSQQQEFPPECRESDYEKRIRDAYPIHPEIFDRLYGDWSTLAKFQRTRGVLRLMAAVIHSLWEKGDQTPLILPASLPIADSHVQFELTRYLSDNWAPILEKDVDGPNSLPLRIDREVPNLGKYSASRRVARTIYLGSAPLSHTANRGIEDRRIKLGCVLPGEPPAVFGDALRRLSSEATYLYQDGPRYWYQTQPTVTKLADDRAENLKRIPESVINELSRRVRKEADARGDLSRVHVFPASSADIPDDPEARLVILDQEALFSRNTDNLAEKKAREILENRGSSPRHFRNALVFLAADQTRFQELDEAIRRYLAWESILADKIQLDLTPHQVRQAETQKETAAKVVENRIPETYQWLLIPHQASPHEAIMWESLRLGQGSDPLALRVSRKLKNEEKLIVTYGATRLRMDLDRIPLWRGDHVTIRQLIEDFGRYLYLPRLKDPQVLLEAIRNGLSLSSWLNDSFAYAESFDESSGRYRGLRTGQSIHVGDNDPGLLVKPDMAKAQIEREKEKSPEEGGSSENPPNQTGASGTSETPPSSFPKGTPRKPRRFHGTVVLDPMRAGRDASKIADEILSHLAGQAGTSLHVTLEIEADLAQGTEENVVRTISENCRTLKFKNFGFEEE